MPPSDELKPGKIELTEENCEYIQKVLQIYCSDSQAVKKAYNSIMDLAKGPAPKEIV